MIAQRLNGQQLAGTMREELRLRCEQFVATGKDRPQLVAILVGNHPSSRLYVNSKKKACEDCGLLSQVHEYPETISATELLDQIQKLNEDPLVHGILVQLPLPPHLDSDTILHAVHPLKDVDGFHPENVGLLGLGSPRYLPCTPFGVQQMIQRYGIPTRGKSVVILGRSNIVGKPLGLILMQKPTARFPQGGDATVTIAHSQSAHLKEITQSAEILIVAIGKPRMVTAEMVRPGAVVIDVGIHSVGGKVVGDVDAESVEKVAAALSPVPKGVGPMTITMLLFNTLQAAELQQSPKH